MEPLEVLGVVGAISARLVLALNPSSFSNVLFNQGSLNLKAFIFQR